MNVRRLSIYVEDAVYDVLSDAAQKQRRRVADEASLRLERAIGLPDQPAPVTFQQQPARKETEVLHAG